MTTTKYVNYMTYDQILSEIPDIAPLLKPYSPLNDDAIREAVVKHLLSKGFVFHDDVPEIKPVIRKVKHRYYLDAFGTVYKPVKGHNI